MTTVTVSWNERIGDLENTITVSVTDPIPRVAEEHAYELMHRMKADQTKPQEPR